MGTRYLDMEGEDTIDDSRDSKIVRFREDIGSRIDSGKVAIENLDSESLIGYLKRIINSIRRDLSNASGTSLLTRAPRLL